MPVVMRERSPLARILLLAVLQCVVLGSLTAPVVVGLSVIVRRWVGADDAPAILAVIIALGSIAAMIANPLFGWCVDATRHRVGRRAWLIGGGIAGLLGTAAVATAPSVVWLAAAWIATQAAYNACYGAINGLVSEGLPPEERTRAAGLFAAAGFLGTLPGLAMAVIFPTDIVPMLLSVPAVAAVVIVIVGVRMERRGEPPVMEGPLRLAEGIALRQIVTPVFAAAFVTRLIISVELAAGLTFALYLFMDRWGYDEATGVRLVAMSTLLGAGGIVLVSALIATTGLRRTPPRILLLAGIGLLAIGMLARGFAPTAEIFQIATVLAGVGIGCGMVATRSLVQATLPPERSAFGLGVFNVANTLGPVVGPLLAAGLVEAAPGWGFVDAYAGMYVLLAVPVVLSLALVPMLRARERSDVSR